MSKIQVNEVSEFGVFFKGGKRFYFLSTNFLSKNFIPLKILLLSLHIFVKDDKGDGNVETGAMKVLRAVKVLSVVEALNMVKLLNAVEVLRPIKVLKAVKVLI